ncbi:MAG: flagellar motor switch protein FliG [bacterium]
MDVRNLPGYLKLAILVQSLDNKSAKDILNNLESSERGIVLKHLSELGDVPVELVEKVAMEFTQMALNKKGDAINHSVDKNRNNNTTNFEENEEITCINAFQSMEPDDIFMIIKDEHPQTIAVILVHLDTKIATEVLGMMDEEKVGDIAMRIANLEKIQTEMIYEINNVFKDVLKDRKVSAAHRPGGIDRLAEILNQSNDSQRQTIMNEIEDIDPEMSARIKERMFIFEDLILVDDKGMQKVLRSVEVKDLAMALKAASDKVKEKVFKNMSSRAVEMLKEEIEMLGAVRMKDVEEAQQKITNIIHDMDAKGELIISGRAGEELIG